jgi:hypothetical protein
MIKALLMLPASRWFVLVAVIAILATVALALIAAHLQVTIPVDSPQAVRLAAFVRAANEALLLLFGFAIVPPAARFVALLLARINHSPQGAPDERTPCQLADLATLGIWALGATGVALALPPFSELIAMAALLSQS